MNDLKIETKTNKTQNEIQFHFGALTRIREGKFVIPFERKTDFEDCITIVDVLDLNSAQIEAIYNAPFMNVSLHTNAFDYIFPRELEGNANKYIYIVKRGKQTFLVNNEGFGYARYIVELKNY